VVAELERELRALGRSVEYPPTPALGRPVRERLALEPAPRRLRLAWLRGRRAVALPGLVVLGAGSTAYAASESVRDAIRDVLGLEGAKIQRSDYPPPAPTQRRLALGEPASLAGASRALAFAPLVPSGLGDPDRLFVRRSVRGGELSLVYLPRPGLPRTATTGVGLLIGESRCRRSMPTASTGSSFGSGAAGTTRRSSSFSCPGSPTSATSADVRTHGWRSTTMALGSTGS
jgi:hypothetical protein